MMEKLRYPIGLQSFRSVREEGKVYVDKTNFIPMILENKFYFLSRPRRFGKSLFLSTLENFFLGRKELFHGLQIESFDWDWVEYPVIRIDLTGANYHLPRALHDRFTTTIQEYAGKFDISLNPSRNLAEQFRRLLKASHEKTGRKVVVLVDEYEKPLLDVIDDEKRLEEYRNELSGIYSVLKSEEEIIKLAFLTGITRFGHLNIFSGLNNLLDISLDRRYTSICGLTENEIITYLGEGIESFAQSNGMDLDRAMETLRENYDGYHFSDDLTDIFNPFSVFTALERGTIDDIWITSGNSNYLLNKLRQSNFNLFELEGIETDRETLEGTDPRYIDPVTLLYQGGYLTIKKYNQRAKSYTLGMPNHEVKAALYKAIIPYYLGPEAKLRNNDVINFSEKLKRGDAEGLMDWLCQFFSKITYDVKLLPLKNRLQQESDFQFVIFSIFALTCELDNLNLEYTTSNGRIDLVVKTSRFIYIFEFKLDNDAESALKQIVDKNYDSSWKADHREIIRIGVAFSPETRHIADYVIDRRAGLR